MALWQIDALTDPKEEGNRIVRILNYKHQENGDFTVYTIKIRVGEYQWTVERRYSQFRDFDRERFQYFTNKTFLPPKKLLGNRDPAFLEKRRSELEEYLRCLFEFELRLMKKLQYRTMPRKLYRFLDFHKYEIHGIVDEMARYSRRSADKWLHQTSSKPKYFELSPVDLHAITERLTLPEPTCDRDSPEDDIGHFVDFLHRLPHLKIRGVKGYLGTSNIPVNQLNFSLNVCKELRSLWVTDCNPTKISGLDNCKFTVKSLVVHYTLTRISDLLAGEECFCVAGPSDSTVDPGSSNQYANKNEVNSSKYQMTGTTSLHQVCCGDKNGKAVQRDFSYMPSWIGVQDADFSFNQIMEIDNSITLLKNVVKLDLSGNRLTELGPNFQHLTKLKELNLNNNGFEKLEDWHAKLGNLKVLSLAGNSVRSLHGLAKLYSLEILDVRDNAIMQTSDVWPVGRLPCLERVELQGNPIESSVEYRTRVLEAFGERAAELILDGEVGSQRELDTVGVRQAIRKAKEEKELLLEKTRQQISEKLRFLENELPSVSDTLPGEDITQRKLKDTPAAARSNNSSMGDNLASVQ